jgi:hypothetical protein
MSSRGSTPRHREESPPPLISERPASTNCEYRSFLHEIAHHSYSVVGGIPPSDGRIPLEAGYIPVEDHTSSRESESSTDDSSDDGSDSGDGASRYTNERDAPRPAPSSHVPSRMCFIDAICRNLMIVIARLTSTLPYQNAGVYGPSLFYAQHSASSGFPSSHAQAGLSRQLSSDHAQSGLWPFTSRTQQYVPGRTHVGTCGGLPVLLRELDLGFAQVIRHRRLIQRLIHAVHSPDPRGQVSLGCSYSASLYLTRSRP